MGQKFSHMLAAGVAVGTLLVPSLASWAGPRGNLRETKHRLAQVRGFIDHGSTRAASLKKQINRLNRRITKAQIALNKLDSEVRRISSSVQSAHARIGSFQHEIDRVEDLATKQAVVLYKAGSTDALDALLTSSSLGELDSRLELMGAAAAENTGALVRFGRLQTQVRQEYRDLFDLETRLHESEATQMLLMRSLASDKKWISHTFGQLKTKLHDHKETERHLEDAAADI
ncbi:MAG: hypothetical protein M3526_00635, partial [Actinomycetota bacterium]|nr:hypothetical protein [Actinomycetota bacterium]